MKEEDEREEERLPDEAMEANTTEGTGGGYVVPGGAIGADSVRHLPGMYQSWFLDYASYVILERAVPHINDGLKPVQRRILHAMRRIDDGRYNKVANVVGQTMQFHPHGDASIGDALVQLGQKDLLIDCQGNWGNILTGDSAAAPRYIEARLSRFALETVFNPKTTVWKQSYDGRNREPVSLPIKFPLLLAQGAEGIAVGLSSKILPHNFNELIDASVACLRGEEFTLYPDFQTGGLVDVAKYNDGNRGGMVKVRARITKVDNRTLAITESPYGYTTGTLIDSIIKANEKGKIKIRKVDDNTAREVEILIHLAPGVSSDKTIDALYAFTDCEKSVYMNCCVIEDNKPRFMSVSEVLRHSTEQTLGLLRTELEIERGELREELFYASLERIFIEERIYKDKEFEQAPDMDVAVAHIDSRLEPFKPRLLRAVTREDILKLMEIKMGRILKFNADRNDEQIARLKSEIKRVAHRDPQLRPRGGHQGGRGQREALHRPRRGLRGHRAEEGRVRLQLLGHRRHHPLLSQRRVQSDAGERKDLRRARRHLRQRLQPQRHTDDLQRDLSRRPRGLQLHQAVCRDRLDARQGVQRDAWHRRLTHPLFQRQSER